MSDLMNLLYDHYTAQFPEMKQKPQTEHEKYKLLKALAGEEQGYLNDDLVTAPADALILPMTDDLAPAIALATRLRTAGIRTQLYTEPKKFKQKMSYADKLGVPYILLLGEDEITQGKVSLKNMATGEQELLPAGEAIGRILRTLGADDAAAPIREPEHG